MFTIAFGAMPGKTTGSANQDPWHALNVKLNAGTDSSGDQNTPAAPYEFGEVPNQASAHQKCIY